jgi:DNA-binding NarL/FixJ family response regulator
VADENPLRRAGHPSGECVFTDPGIPTKLPPIAVIAGWEMKASIVFDLAFGLPTRLSNLRCRSRRNETHNMIANDRGTISRRHSSQAASVAATAPLLVRCRVRRAAFMSAHSRPIRILTVDDHPLLRAGIEALVSSQPDMLVVGECSNGRDAIHQFRAHRPDVTLMDLQMPEMSGTDAIIAIRDEFPDARIIVLTTYVGDVQALRALQAGARGYLLKDAAQEEVLGTIRAVHAGKKTLSPAVSHEIAEHATEDSLTKGEIDVLRLIAEGKANKQIADHLSIAEETVKSRVKNILSKLSADDRTHAAMIGLKRGIIGP